MRGNRVICSFLAGMGSCRAWPAGTPLRGRGVFPRYGYSKGADVPPEGEFAALPELLLGPFDPPTCRLLSPLVIVGWGISWAGAWTGELLLLGCGIRPPHTLTLRVPGSRLPSCPPPSCCWRRRLLGFARGCHGRDHWRGTPAAKKKGKKTLLNPRETALELVSGADFLCKLMRGAGPVDLRGSRGRFPGSNPGKPARKF